MNSRDIIERLTAKALQDALAVSGSSIKEARRAGTFPASWYATMLPMARDAGFELPLTAFNFRAPDRESAA